MKKIVFIVVGAVVTLIGLGLAVGGVALMAIFGSDGIYDAPRERIDTATHALVSEPVELEHGAPFNSDFGDVTVRLRARASEDRDIFLGVGPAQAVDDYLRGTSYDVVKDWRYGGEGDAITKTRVEGESSPTPPTERSFWTVKASGSGDEQIAWKLRSGTYRLVVMNADGSAGVDVRGKWGVEIPWIFPLGIGLLVAGFVALLLGIILLVVGIRSRSRPTTPPTTTVGEWALE